MKQRTFPARWRCLTSASARLMGRKKRKAKFASGYRNLSHLYKQQYWSTAPLASTAPAYRIFLRGPWPAQTDHRCRWGFGWNSNCFEPPECRALANVRFGSLADICGAKCHVRFTPNSDRESRHPRQAMSALPLKAGLGFESSLIVLWPFLR